MGREEKKETILQKLNQSGVSLKRGYKRKQSANLKPFALQNKGNYFYTELQKNRNLADLD